MNDSGSLQAMLADERLAARTKADPCEMANKGKTQQQEQRPNAGVLRFAQNDQSLFRGARNYLEPSTEGRNLSGPALFGW